MNKLTGYALEALRDPEGFFDPWDRPTVKALTKDWGEIRTEFLEAAEDDRTPRERAAALSCLLLCEEDAFLERIFTELEKKLEDADWKRLIDYVSRSCCLLSVAKEKALFRDNQEMMAALCDSLPKCGPESIRELLFFLWTLKHPKVEELAAEEFDRSADDEERRFAAAKWLSLEAQHLPSLELMIRHLRNGAETNRRPQALFTLKSFAASQDPIIASIAEATLAELIGEAIDADEQLPNAELNQGSLHAFLTNAQNPENLRLATALGDPKVVVHDKVLRQLALAAQARLGAGESDLDLMAKLQQPETRAGAALALVELRGSDLSPQEIRVLGETLKKLGDYEELAIALRDSGSPGGIELIRGSRYAAQLFKKADGMTLERIGEIGVESGLLEKFPNEEQLEEAREICVDDESSDYLACSLLHVAGCLVGFDMESDQVPPPYEELLEEFAEASNGVFKPEEIVQTGDIETEQQVTFEFSGKRHEFTAEDFNDWYDTESVVKAVEQALETAGESRRFVEFYSDGQNAYFVFGEPEAIQRFSTTTGIPLEDQ